jgi:hypothetical protein
MRLKAPTRPYSDGRRRHFSSVPGRTDWKSARIAHPQHRRIGALARKCRWKRTNAGHQRARFGDPRSPRDVPRRPGRRRMNAADAHILAAENVGVATFATHPERHLGCATDLRRCGASVGWPRPTLLSVVRPLARLCSPVRSCERRSRRPRHREFRRRRCGRRRAPLARQVRGRCTLLGIARRRRWQPARSGAGLQRSGDRGR